MSCGLLRLSRFRSVCILPGFETASFTGSDQTTNEDRQAQKKRETIGLQRDIINFQSQLLA